MNLIDYASNRKFFDQQLINSHQSSSRSPIFSIATATYDTNTTNITTRTTTSTSITAAAAAFASARIMPTYNNSSSSSNSQSQSNANTGNGSAASPSSCFNMNEYPNDYTDQPVVTNHTGCYSQDANKAFDDVVFDILKVDPDIIAGQLTLIDLPLFKAIEPDELISCKWMSREKLVKAPNIVQFTRRFNQTTFWCQKEILNCKRIETRGKMISHFIKMAKRLNELHSFNSLMAIIVALKAAPIYRLKKTWSQHVPKKDVTTFDRLADLMFDTSDNKRKIRDMHMNCKLPCIPFLGLFLTDLIHIDIAHPHNSFDNPQRRNQMNNICRLISEYQQSNYQESSSLSCCCGSGSCGSGGMGGGGGGDSGSGLGNSGCTCSHHHYGGGIINSDGTIFINEVSYVKNYLNSFLYIEELQKFKEDENYRDSLELEPDSTSTTNTPNVVASDALAAKLNGLNEALALTPKLNTNGLFSPGPSAAAAADSANSQSINQHRKTNSIANNLFNVTNILSNPISLNTTGFNANFVFDSVDSGAAAAAASVAVKHPLDDSIVETSTHDPTLQATCNLISDLPHLNLNLNGSNGNSNHKSSKTEQQSIGASLLKDLLKHRHSSAQANSHLAAAIASSGSHHKHHSSAIRKFNCYSSRSNADDDDDDEYDMSTMTNSDAHTRTPNLRSNSEVSGHATNGAGSTLKSSQSQRANGRRLSGRNLIKNFNDELKKSGDAAQKLSLPSGAIITSTTGLLLSNSLNTTNNDSMHAHTLSNCTNIDPNDLSSAGDLNGSLTATINNQTPIIIFESPIKRKCIIKNFQKPRFSQWKSYWLQLVGGNLLIYYPSKSMMFMRGGSGSSGHSSSGASERKASDAQNGGAKNLTVPAHELGALPHVAISSSEASQLPTPSTSSEISSIDQQQMQLQQLQLQLQGKKVNYHKNPCKMHPIASWMVVNLFQDKENEMMAIRSSSSANGGSATAGGVHHNNGLSSSSSASAASSSASSSQNYSKFDIQLNDLNNGNMYKYRFDSLQLAKEWYEQFKLASTYHERQKPDNLIRFD